MSAPGSIVRCRIALFTPISTPMMAAPTSTARSRPRVASLTGPGMAAILPSRRDSRTPPRGTGHDPFVPVGRAGGRCYAAPAVRTPILLYALALLVRIGLTALYPDPAYPDSYYYVDVARALAATGR